jgi:hypothetical protein
MRLCWTGASVWNGYLVLSQSSVFMCSLEEGRDETSN